MPRAPRRLLTTALAAGLLLPAGAAAGAAEPAAPAAVTVDGPGEQAPADFVPAGPTLDSTTPLDDTSTTSTERTVAALDEPIVFTGRGNGHGIGLSQYGARGQALVGRSASTILGHYYRGSSIASRTVSFDPRIGVALDRPATRLIVRGGDATIRFNGRARDTVPGHTWEVRIVESTGECIVNTPNGAQARFRPPSGAPCARANPKGNDATARIDVHLSSGGGWSRYGQYGRDSFVEVIPDQVGSSWRVDVVVDVPLEQYLYGLAEVPYSWERPVLRSQAIAGRSYALYRLLQVGDNPDRGCSCHLYDSQQDQVYDGWDREQGAGWSRWKQAVDDTARKIVSAPGQIGTLSGVVQAFYSSSSNGRTEAKHELWGGSRYPYLVSVADSWALSPSTGNPHRAWQVPIARSTVAARAGLDQLTAVEVTDRSTSGATTEVRFIGVDGGSQRAVTASGSWARSAFGLRSTTFQPTSGNAFTDIAGSVHADDIRWLARREITTGCNSAGSRFCPNGSVTRGQMAAFINRAFDLPPGGKVFNDTRGHLFQDDIAALWRAGITSGCNSAATRFCPDADVTRAEMAAFLQRAEGLALGPRTTFRDARTHLHSRAIEAIRRAEITYGCNPPANTRFCPNDDVTRAQMASFIRRTVQR